MGPGNITWLTNVLPMESKRRQDRLTQSKADAEKKRTELKKVKIDRLEKERAEHEAAKAALPGRLEAEKERDARSLQRLAVQVSHFEYIGTIAQTIDGFRRQAEDLVAKMKEVTPDDEDAEVDLKDPELADMYD